MGFILAVTSSCKSLYDIDNYVPKPASGLFASEAWNFAYGFTDPEAKLPDGFDTMIILVSSKPKSNCPDRDDPLLSGKEIAIAIESKSGESHILQNSGAFETEDDLFRYEKQKRVTSVAFIDHNESEQKRYRFATKGKVKILRKSKTDIEGSIMAKFSKSFYINGKFRAKICQFGQLN